MTPSEPLWRAAVQEVLDGRRRYTVVHADCRDVLPLMQAKSVQHVITDPPFSANVHNLQRRMLRGAGAGQTHRTYKARDGKGRGEVGYVPLGFEHLSPELRRFCGWQFARVATRWILVKTDVEGREAWQADLEHGGARHIRPGIWHKIGAQPQLNGMHPAMACEMIEVAHARKRRGGERVRWNGGGLHAYWEHAIATDRTGAGGRTHPTETPLSLWLELVGQFTDPGEVVLDAFAGTGSLGQACVRLGRRYIGVELDAEQKGWACIAAEKLEAEERGLSLKAARAGQQSLFADSPLPSGR